MTYSAPLSRLHVGWQKVADMYNMTVHVFQTGDTYLAVSNEAQGVGHLVQIRAPGGLWQLGDNTNVRQNEIVVDAEPVSRRWPSRVERFGLDFRASSTSIPR
jgi:hypothetical protein